MRPINVDMLMGHSTGISDSYYRPPEKDLLEDYLKAVPDLTIFKPAATEEQLKARMDSDQELVLLKKQMAQMRQDLELHDQEILQKILLADYAKWQERQM